MTFLTSKKCKINLIDLIKEGFNTKFLSQSIQRLYISHIKILVGIYCFAGSLVSGKITFSKYTYVSGNIRFPILYPTPNRIFPEIYVYFRKYTYVSGNIRFPDLSPTYICQTQIRNLIELRNSTSSYVTRYLVT